MKKFYIFIIMFMIFASACFADDIGFVFDSNKQYDIYLKAYENQSLVIKNVKIIKRVQILDADFLVIETSSASLKENLGYIRFDAIIAVLAKNSDVLSATGTFKIGQ
ncbi:MAG: hypothetical protein PHI86_04870 [Candidatus Omnitrophica bacterium]|nr:hypothetical protein [Candidatus Omnitrophota bacterium]HOX54399.1 hypothetical protein [Candidatus Omnitrophota bacterium]